MLGIIKAPSKDEHERARVWAASALAALALMMLMLLIGRPPHTDLLPPPLRAGQLTMFAHNLNACRGALAQAGFQTELVADVHAGQCGYHDAVRLGGMSSTTPIETSCALAAGLALWERDVVAPAARRIYGQPVQRIDLAGPSYACRSIAGRADHRLSEHAYANAIDIGGFTLADGRSVTVARGWRAGGADANFLHAVRDGACRDFQAVLSPDYNADHQSHLHFDLGRDKLCR